MRFAPEPSVCISQTWPFSPPPGAMATASVFPSGETAKSVTGSSECVIAVASPPLVATLHSSGTPLRFERKKTRLPSLENDGEYDARIFESAATSGISAAMASSASSAIGAVLAGESPTAWSVEVLARAPLLSVKKSTGGPGSDLAK